MSELPQLWAAADGQGQTLRCCTQKVLFSFSTFLQVSQPLITPLICHHRHPKLVPYFFVFHFFNCKCVFYIIEMYFIWCFCSLLISISRCSIISCYTSFFLLFDAVRVLKMCPFSLQTILVSSFFSALFGITCYLPVLDLKAYTLHYFELIVIVIRSVETSLLLPSVLMSLWLSCLI